MRQKAEHSKAYEYLDKVREARRRVRQLEQRIANLRSLLTDTSAHVTKTRTQSAPGDKMLSITAQIDELEREKVNAEKAAEEIRLEVGMMICRIEDPMAQRVLILRYLEGKNWKKIVNEMRTGNGQVFRFHEIGLSSLERILEL